MPPKKQRKVAKVYIRNQDGTGFWGDVWGGVKKASRFIKDNKLVSKAADAAGFGKVANAARMVGLGRKRKGRKKTQRGGASGVVRF